MKSHIEYTFVDRYGNPVSNSNIEEIINNTIAQIVYPEKVDISIDYDFLDNGIKELLTLEEKGIIYEMLSICSYKFRSDYKITNKNKRDIWNKIILSLPKCNRKTIYRYLNEYDIINLHVGDILKIEHSLTTTKIGRGFMDKNKWIGKYIIKRKLLKNTKAHDVSVLWNPNYSILKGEKQVNFEEGALFQIDRVVNVHGKPYIYMHKI